MQSLTWDSAVIGYHRGMHGPERLPQGARLDRASDERDLAEVRELFLAYAAELPISLDFQGFERELESLPGAYGPPAGGLWLAWAHNRAVGCCGLRPLADGCAEMKRLYVVPAMRGYGFGRALALQSLEMARQLGYRRVRLDTLASMAGARRLYGELGFREIPPYYANPNAGTVYLELLLE